MCFFGGGDSGAGDARRLEEERKAHINEGMARIDETFAPFNSGYYADYENKYRDLGIPDVNTQYRDAVQQTRYGLARSGNLDSSAASKAYRDLRERNTQAELKVSDDARAASAAQRAAIESSRNSVVSQLSATENPSAAAQAAAAQAATLSRPPTYSPITGIFADLSGLFASNEQARRAGLPGWGWGVTSQSSPLGSPSSVKTIA